MSFYDYMRFASVIAVSVILASAPAHAASTTPNNIQMLPPLQLSGALGATTTSICPTIGSGDAQVLAWDGQNALNCVSGLLVNPESGSINSKSLIASDVGFTAPANVVNPASWTSFIPTGITFFGSNTYSSIGPLGFNFDYTSVAGSGVVQLDGVNGQFKIQGTAASGIDINGTNFSIDGTGDVSTTAGNFTTKSGFIQTTSGNIETSTGDVGGTTVTINGVKLDQDSATTLNNIVGQPTGCILTKTSPTTFSCTTMPVTPAPVPTCAANQILGYDASGHLNCINQTPPGASPLYVRNAATLGVDSGGVAYGGATLMGWNQAMAAYYATCVAAQGVATCAPYADACVFYPGGSSDGNGSNLSATQLPSDTSVPSYSGTYTSPVTGDQIATPVDLPSLQQDYHNKVYSVTCEQWMCQGVTGKYAALAFIAGTCAPGQTPSNTPNPSCDPNGRPVVSLNCLSTY